MKTGEARAASHHQTMRMIFRSFARVACVGAVLVGSLGLVDVASAEEVAGFAYTPIAPDTVGGTGAPNVSWTMPGAPSTGLTTVQATFVPTVADGGTSNKIYWAYSSSLVGGNSWYMGIQPNNSLGKTALFSVFGEGTTPVGAACSTGADGGAGSKCHMPYPFQLGSSYTMRATRVAATATDATWEGSIRDDASGVWTTIGSIKVNVTGLLRPTGVTFTEFYARSMPCADRPVSEALIHSIRGDNGSGTSFSGRVSKINANGGLGGCNPLFFSDHGAYAYLRQGTVSAQTTTAAPTTTVAPVTTVVPVTTAAPTTTLPPTTTAVPTTLAPTTTRPTTTTVATTTPVTTVAPTTTPPPTTTLVPTTAAPSTTTTVPTTRPTTTRPAKTRVPKATPTTTRPSSNATTGARVVKATKVTTKKRVSGR
jgi:hypothetical protein